MSNVPLCANRCRSITIMSRNPIMHLFRKTLSLPAMAMLALSLISCASVNPGVNHLTAERPKDEAFRKELKKELSSLNIAVEASASELSDTLNRIIKRELYKGSTKTRGLTADVLRNGPIIVSAADNYLYLTIPTTISLSYGVFETPAIAARLKFKLNAKVTPDWKIKVDVHYTGLSDLLTDEVGIGPGQVGTLGFGGRPRREVSGAWWLLPIFMGWLGGLIAWLINREDDPQKARAMLITGIVISGAILLLFLAAATTSRGF